VYIDIWGPTPVLATNGEKYYVAFLDAYSKYTWVYMLYSKSQFSSVFVHFKTMAENQTNAKLKFIQTDNAKEFLTLACYLNMHGICHHLTCPHAHQQNGSIERKH